MTAMKDKGTGFTLIELLTVLAVIALLVGILVPSLNMVRNSAKNAAQRAQFIAIEQALMSFRSDYGDYPESDNYDLSFNLNDYCGAQKLAEALMGWDLLGFHPESNWQADGVGADRFGRPIYPLNPSPADLNARKGPYLEFSTANAFRLGISSGMRDGLLVNTGALEPDTYVLCDSFIVRKVSLAGGRTVTAGTPILYYRADTSQNELIYGGRPPGRWSIYNWTDNYELIRVMDLEGDGVLGDHPLSEPSGRYFCSDEYKIMNPLIMSKAQIVRPYRPDSYILISAGVDGLYGTRDDITNFGN